MSNLRFPKVFVFDPTQTPIAVDSDLKIASLNAGLSAGQVGVFNSVTGAGIGNSSGGIASVSASTVPVIEIHQNLGNTRFGTIRSKPIYANRVRKFYAVKARNAQQQITYLGYKESGTDTLVIKKNDSVSLTILLYEKSLTRWYGPTPYSKRFDIDLSFCKSCVSDCTVLDADSVADAIVAAINDTKPANQFFEGGSELPNYLTASKVATGTGDSRKVGVKIVTKAIDQDKLNSCDPKQFYETKLVTFTASFDNNCITAPVTYSQTADPGEGWAGMVADMERESQGYDTVRDQFEDPQWMKLANFVINAKDGVKYDLYYLDFEFHSKVTGGQTNKREEDYTVIFAVPTETGNDGPTVSSTVISLEAVFNAWLNGLGFTAVTLSTTPPVTGNATNNTFNA